MAQQLQKKFIGDNQVDGDKLLLEQGQSIRAKDSTSTEVDLIKLNVTDQLVIPSDVVVEGDLVVQGAITSIESATLQVTDANVVVNKDGTVASADSAGAGITVEMSDATDAAISFDSSLASKFKMGEVGAQAQVVTVSHTQTLSNKSIDADSNTISNLEVDNFKSGVLDTDLSSVSASDDTIASAKAVKSYVDTEVSSVQSELDATQSGAGLDSEGAYVPNVAANYISGATSLHQADQSLDSALKTTSDALAQEITDRSNAVSAVADDVSHLVSLSGVAVDSDDLGSFTGTTIPDSQNIKQALQALESAVESVSGGGSSTQLELDATQVGAGLEADGAYIAPMSGNYISVAVSLKDADVKLDSQLKTVTDDLASHIAIGVDAHDASAISVASIPNLAATDVQGALAELQLDIDGINQSIGDLTASDIAFSAIGNLSATDVQAAIQELDTEKVAKAGDTMEGSLVMDFGSAGISTTISDISIQQINSNSSTTIQADEVSCGSVNGDLTASGTFYSGNLELNATDAATGDSASAQFSVASNSSTILQTASDSVNLFDGNSSLSISSLDFIYNDNATGMQSTTNYQHNLISIYQNDGTNSASFTVTPGVSVELLSNGAAVTPTADSHLVPKKYVDDEIAAQSSSISDHLNDSVDAHDASAISFSAAGNIAATQVQAAIEELDSEKVSRSGDTISGTYTLTGNIAAGDANFGGTGFSVINPAGAIVELTENGVSAISASSSDIATLAAGSLEVSKLVSGTTKQFLVQNGFAKLQTSAGVAVMPVSDQDLAVKKYVDDSVSTHVNDATDAHDASAISLSPAVNGETDVQGALEDHETRIDVLESVVWFKEKFDISNGQTFVTLSHTPEPNSMSAFVDRLAIHEGAGEDYTILGTTMTFLNDLVFPGNSEIGAGDTVYVKYQYKV